MGGKDEVTLTNGALEVSVSAAAGGITSVRVLSGTDGSSSSSSSSEIQGKSQVHIFSSTFVQYAAEGLFYKPGAYIFATHKESKVGAGVFVIL